VETTAAAGTAPDHGHYRAGRQVLRRPTSCGASQVPGSPRRGRVYCCSSPPRPPPAGTARLPGATVRRRLFFRYTLRWDNRQRPRHHRAQATCSRVMGCPLRRDRASHERQQPYPVRAESAPLGPQVRGPDVGTAGAADGMDNSADSAGQCGQRRGHRAHPAPSACCRGQVAPRSTRHYTSWPRQAALDQRASEHRA
jgi:hypothetical protein